MFTSKKIVSLVMLVAVSLQGCSKGVSPTQNLQSATEETPQGVLQDSVNQQICLLQNDVDTDGDGICDSDEDAGCEDTDSCEPGVQDEQKKSRGWVPWVIGGAVVAVAGSWFATSKSGFGTKSWPKDLIDNNEQKDLDQLITFFRKDHPVAGLTDMVAESKEEFFSKDGKVYAYSVNYMKLDDAYAFSQDYRSINGNLIRSGSELAMCTSGALGISYQGQQTVQWQTVNSDGVSVTTTPTSVQKVKGTYHINKAAYNLSAKNISRQNLTRTQFETYCKNHPGVYTALAKKPKTGNVETQFYIYAFPLAMYKTFQEAGGDYNLDVEFWIKGVGANFPATAASMIGTEYRGINPNFTTYQGLDHKFDTIGATEASAYDNCATTYNTYNPAFTSVNACKSAAVFGLFGTVGAAPSPAVTVTTSLTPAETNKLKTAVRQKAETQCSNAKKDPASNHNADYTITETANGTMIWIPCTSN